jgi:hypothetical protein
MCGLIGGSRLAVIHAYVDVTKHNNARMAIGRPIPIAVNLKGPTRTEATTGAVANANQVAAPAARVDPTIEIRNTTPPGLRSTAPATRNAKAASIALAVAHESYSDAPGAFALPDAIRMDAAVAAS